MPVAVVTPYASYAEGYRAPSITETLVNGPHAGATALQFILPLSVGYAGPGRQLDLLFPA